MTQQGTMQLERSTSSPRLGRTLGGIAVLAALAACGANLDELQQWMEQQKREVKPSVTPLSPPRKFDPQPYTVADAVRRVRCWRWS
jgi:type IV pilus assembly protein PilP